MKQFTQQAFRQTRSFIRTHARPIDQALFAFHFEGDSSDAVLAALAPYQNEDGGFGNALEPDLRTAASSAVATQQGFNILRAVGATAVEPMVQAAVNYLLETLDKELLCWEIVPPAVEDAPHAPWWTYGESAGSADSFRSNPRPALIGFLYEYQTLVPDVLLSQLIEAQIKHLATQATESGVDMNALFCYITLATSPNLPIQHRQQLTALLLDAVRGTVATDPNDFGNYQLLPLDVAPTPDALLAATVDDEAIDAHLNYLIDTQSVDGSWPIPWSWAFVDEEAWGQAEQDWKGHIAVNRLRMLAAHGRFEI